MMAVVVPGRAVKLTLHSTGEAAPGVGEADVAQFELAVAGARSVTPSAGGTTEVSVSSTSPMRSADTDARGTITNMNVDIITAIRICTR